MAAEPQLPPAVTAEEFEANLQRLLESYSEETPIGHLIRQALFVKFLRKIHEQQVQKGSLYPKYRMSDLYTSNFFMSGSTYFFAQFNPTTAEHITVKDDWTKEHIIVGLPIQVICKFTDEIAGVHKDRNMLADYIRILQSVFRCFPVGFTFCVLLEQPVSDTYMKIHKLPLIGDETSNIRCFSVKDADPSKIDFMCLTPQKVDIDEL